MPTSTRPKSHAPAKARSTPRKKPAAKVATPPKQPEEFTLRLLGAQFRAALSAAAVAMDRSGSRPALCGVHMFRQENNLIFECTDTYRLHRCTIDLDPYHEAATLAAVPADWNVLVALTPETLRWTLEVAKVAGHVEVTVTPETFKVYGTDRTITLRTVDGDFPNVASILADSKLSLTEPVHVNPENLTGVCRAAKLIDRRFGVGRLAIAGGHDPMKPIRFTASSEELKVSLLAVVMPIRVKR